MFSSKPYESLVSPALSLSLSVRNKPCLSLLVWNQRIKSMQIVLAYKVMCFLLVLAGWMAGLNNLWDNICKQKRRYVQEWVLSLLLQFRASLLFSCRAGFIHSYTPTQIDRLDLLALFLSTRSIACCSRRSQEIRRNGKSPWKNLSSLASDSIFHSQFDSSSSSGANYKTKNWIIKKIK